MELEDVLDLAEHMQKQRNEEHMYLRWLVGPQFEVSFDEFKRSLMPQKPKTDEEIMAEVYALFGEVKNGT